LTTGPKRRTLYLRPARKLDEALHGALLEIDHEAWRYGDPRGRRLIHEPCRALRSRRISRSIRRRLANMRSMTT
jgi:hypothetical protein